MNVVDSSAWIEYFEDGQNAEAFSDAIESPEELVVSSLTLFEVYKRVSQAADERLATAAVGLMLQGRIVDLSATLAISAAQVSMETGLPMADSIILATARAHDATLWTQDVHFEGLPRVAFRAKP